MDQTHDDDLNFDFDTVGITDVNQLGSQFVPPGRYHAEVFKVEKDQNGNTPAMKFTFRVTDGPFKNKMIFERLFLTEKNKQRIVLFANRLGLIGQGDLNQPNVRKNWGAAKDQKVVIEVEHKEFDKKDGSKGKSANLSFAGIWHPGSPDVADVPRSGPAAPPPAGPAGGGGAVTAEFDDL